MSVHVASRRLRWLVNRLSCMSLPEVFHRVAQAGVKEAVKRPLAYGGTKPVRTTEHIAPFVRPPEGIQAEGYIREADSILNGKVILFAAREFDVGCPPNWNRDPSTGVVGPLTFGQNIRVTNGALVGDIKHVWELIKPAFASGELAQAYSLSGQRRYLDGLAAQLTSWLEQCPP